MEMLGNFKDIREKSWKMGNFMNGFSPVEESFD